MAKALAAVGLLARGRTTHGNLATPSRSSRWISRLESEGADGKSPTPRLAFEGRPKRHGKAVVRCGGKHLPGGWGGSKTTAVG